MATKKTATKAAPLTSTKIKSLAGKGLKAPSTLSTKETQELAAICDGAHKAEEVADLEFSSLGLIFSQQQVDAGLA